MAYDVFIDGYTTSSPEELVAKLSARYQVPANELLGRLNQGRFRVKANLDLAQARTVAAYLTDLGAVCSIEAQDGSTVDQEEGIGSKDPFVPPEVVATPPLMELEEDPRERPIPEPEEPAVSSETAATRENVHESPQRRATLQYCLRVFAFFLVGFVVAHVVASWQEGSFAEPLGRLEETYRQATTPTLWRALDEQTSLTVQELDSMRRHIIAVFLAVWLVTSALCAILSRRIYP